MLSARSVLIQRRSELHPPFTRCTRAPAHYTTSRVAFVTRRPAACCGRRQHRNTTWLAVDKSPVAEMSRVLSASHCDCRNVPSGFGGNRSIRHTQPGSGSCAAAAVNLPSGRQSPCLIPRSTSRSKVCSLNDICILAQVNGDTRR